MQTYQLIIYLNVYPSCQLPKSKVHSHFTLYPARYLALQTKNSTITPSAINPVTAENADDSQGRHNHSYKSTPYTVREKKWNIKREDNGQSMMCALYILWYAPKGTCWATLECMKGSYDANKR